MGDDFVREGIRAVQIEDETLSHVTRLMGQHNNRFGRYPCDRRRMRQDLDRSPTATARSCYERMHRRNTRQMERAPG